MTLFVNLAIRIILGIIFGIIIGFTAICINRLFIKKHLKSITEDAVKKILADDKSYYEGLNYKKHLNLKTDMQKQLVKAGKLDAKDVIASTPPHAVITEKSPTIKIDHRIPKKTESQKASKKPITTKKSLPVIKLLKGR